MDISIKKRWNRRELSDEELELFGYPIELKYHEDTRHGIGSLSFSLWKRDGEETAAKAFAKMTLGDARDIWIKWISEFGAADSYVEEPMYYEKELGFMWDCFWDDKDKTLVFNGDFPV